MKNYVTGSGTNWNFHSLAAETETDIWQRNVSIEDMVYPIFKEINYLTYEETEEFSTSVYADFGQRTSRQSGRRRKGDALVENGMYVNAIQVYQKISWKEDDLESAEKRFCRICSEI